MCHLGMCVLKWSMAKMHWLMWPNAVLLLFPLCLNGLHLCVFVNVTSPLSCLWRVFLCVCVCLWNLNGCMWGALALCCFAMKMQLLCVLWSFFYCVLSLIQQFMSPFHVFENCHIKWLFLLMFVCFYLSSVCLLSVCLSSVFLSPKKNTKCYFKQFETKQSALTWCLCQSPVC